MSRTQNKIDPSIDALRESVALHDSGKIDISREVLDRARKLVSDADAAPPSPAESAGQFAERYTARRFRNSSEVATPTETMFGRLIVDVVTEAVIERDAQHAASLPPRQSEGGGT